MQGIDINNSSLQQHAVNMTFQLKGDTGNALQGQEIWVPEGHLYIIDNLIITNGHTSAVQNTIYLMQNQSQSNSYVDYYTTQAVHFIHTDGTTPAGRGGLTNRIWRKSQDAHTSDRPFGDSPFYLMAGQGLTIYTATNNVCHATYSFRDCF